MSDTPAGPGSWQASDGKWYRAEQRPGAQPPPPPGAPGFQHGSPPGVQAPLASWGERVVAYLIDGAILFAGFLVVFVVAAVFGAIVDFFGALIAFFGYLAVTGASFYFLYMQGATGASPGKRLTGLRVVGEHTGQPIGGRLGIVRGLAHVVDSLICSIGYLLPLWDAKRQTIADKIMNTVVIANQPKQPLGPEVFTV